jgi:hypothetical protein
LFRRPRLAIPLAVALLTGGCRAAPATGPAPPTLPPRAPVTSRLPSLIWVLAASHFNQVVAVSSVRALFSAGTVYEPMTARQSPSPLVRVIPTADFHSEALLADAIVHHTLPRGVKAVIYDNERFPNTPADEQANIAHYSQLAAALAARAGLQSICDFIQPDRLPRAERTPVHEVPDCSIIGLNTVQQSERQVGAYREVVARAVAVIRKVRPDVPIIAGLSANPRGAPVTAAELAADMRATVGLVDGFCLNVPAPGVGCPACHQPNPALMAEALARFAAHPGAGTTRHASGVAAAGAMRWVIAVSALRNWSQLPVVRGLLGTSPPLKSHWSVALPKRMAMMPPASRNLSASLNPPKRGTGFCWTERRRP